MDAGCLNDYQADLQKRLTGPAMMRLGSRSDSRPKRLHPRFVRACVLGAIGSLARHYGFTEDELDFISNFDTKYWMGRAAGEGEE